jgi:cytoskeletal protein RodZ
MGGVLVSSLWASLLWVFLLLASLLWPKAGFAVSEVNRKATHKSASKLRTAIFVMFAPH